MQKMKKCCVALWMIILFCLMTVCEPACTLSGCLVCDPSDNTICISCDGINGFYLTSTTCSLCTSSRGTHCATCDSSQCLTCITGWTLNYSVSQPICVSCALNINNCIECSSTSVCTKCATNYVLDTSSPPVCIPDCSPILDCLTCTIGSGGPICSTCNAGFFLNSTTNKCLPCTDILNCINCESNGKCTQCDTDYWIDFSTNNRTCSQCLLYQCLSCTDGPQCASCEKGYYLSSIYKLCFKCQYPCIQCDSTSTNCTKCPSTGLYYYDSASFTCKLCSVNLTNCKKCNLQGDICEQCQSDYFYIDTSTKKCLPCPTPCKQCLSQTVCLSCLANDHIFVPSTNQCQTCISHIQRCITCLSETVCLTCDTVGGPFFLTYPPKKCVTCQQAHPNCIDCSYVPLFGPGCDRCISNYFVQNYLCIKCPQLCLTCNSLTDCTMCLNASYIIKNGICVQCKQVITNCSLCNFPNTCIFCTNSTVAIMGSIIFQLFRMLNMCLNIIS